MGKISETKAAAKHKKRMEKAWRDPSKQWQALQAAQEEVENDLPAAVRGSVVRLKQEVARVIVKHAARPGHTHVTKDRGTCQALVSRGEHRHRGTDLAHTHTQSRRQ